MLEGRVTRVVTLFVATPVKLNPISVSTVNVTGFGSIVVTNKSKGSEQSLSVNPRKNSLAALSRTFPVEMKNCYLIIASRKVFRLRNVSVVQWVDVSCRIIMNFVAPL